MDERSAGRVNLGGPLGRRGDVDVATSPPGADQLADQLRGFVASEYPAVVAAVGLITGDRAGAEDAVQDAMVRLLARPPAEPIRSLGAWITVVASNGARSARRRRGSEERALGRLAARGGAPAVAAPVEPGDDEVLAAVRALPLRQRQICVMHYHLDRPVAEVAAALGVAEGTVKTQLHRARAALAAALGEPTGDGEVAP